MGDVSAVATWAHTNPVGVLGGRGALRSLVSLLPGEGNVLLVTTGGSTRRGLTSRVVEQIGAARVSVYDRVTPNPELDDLDQATERFGKSGIRAIVAVGGGSAIDSAKVLAVTLPSGMQRPLEQCLRNGQGQSWTTGLPVIAVPTTSGTGAEVTPFATVWDTVNHKKHSVAGNVVYPTHALLDPELTVALPDDETLYSALDAISHALESLWNRNRTPVSVACSRQALALARTALPAVRQEPGNVDERAKMQNAALLAGLAISQTRTAVAHSISYPLTSRFGVPHGLACSFTLAELLSMNLDDLAAHPGDASFFQSILGLLQELHLGARVKRYASIDQILACQGEMQTVERLGNYAGELTGGFDDLIAKALA